MRKVASKRRWQARSVVVALALAVGILGLLLLSSSVKAVPPPFYVSVSTDVSDTEHLANADIESTFNVDDDPWPAAYYQNQFSFVPAEWGIAAGATVPVGAVVGKLSTVATVGWFNNPCWSALALDFDPLMNCTIDKSETVTFDEQFNNLATVADGCTKWPEFLDTMFPGMTPVARHAGFEQTGGVDLSLNFLTFEPGTSLPDTAAPGSPSLGAELGYVAISVLNNPTAALVPNQITDNCAPLTTNTTYYGLTLDNPATGANEAGYEWRTNPQYGGTYTFYGYAGSMYDADSDGTDNRLDTCPHISDPEANQKTGAGDDDADGLQNACDPDDTDGDIDADADGYPNRQDNCPLVQNGKDPITLVLIGPNDQEDSDIDGIGDVCDQDDWNDDGDETDPGEPTHFSVSTVDGDFSELWFETDIEISGPPPPEAGVDSDDDGFDDVTEADLGSCWEDPCDEEEFCSGTEAADSTPEGTSEAGSCGDGEDNDRDGYADDVDGSCGDDTDGDGASDEGEEDLGSDPEDAHSTPEDSSVCDVCSDGVDNDGDGAIDGDDEGCAAAAVTPTVTGTPTGTAEPTDVTPTPTVTTVEDICAPVFPGTYSGSVRIDGQPAASGYEVTASVDGVEWGSAIVSSGRYAMDIPDHLPSAPPCFEGGTITFALDGMTCTASPDAEWASGLQSADLDCAPAAPPVTPTEEPTATPTTPAGPTVTPTAPPPSGAGGLSGSSSGLPLWAIALAGWAGLMIVAGLGTLVAAKRR
jgi:hypothetical protein